MAISTLKKPRKTCDDKNCPFHGTLPVRGRALEGVVVSTKMNKTVIVRCDFLKYVPKFKRYERRRSHIPVHRSPCLQVAENDRVRISECRPISKTVSFVVVEKVEGEKVGSEG